MNKILTTTKSLLIIPPIDTQLEHDLCKLSIWKANIVLRKLKGDENGLRRETIQDKAARV